MLDNDRLRLRFEATHLMNRLPISITLPDRKGEPPFHMAGGDKHYIVRAATPRGTVRRHATKVIAMRRLRSHNRSNDTDVRFDSQTARLLMIGGVKGEGKAPQLSPQQYEQIRETNPLLELFGMGDPAFMSGVIYMSHMESVEPFTDPEYLNIIRRGLHNDMSIPISDPETIEEYSRYNRMRSRLTDAEKLLGPLERNKTKLDERRRKNYDNILASLNEEFGQQFKNHEDVEKYLAKVKEEMDEKGHATVSEQNLQGIYVLPGRTEMNHRMDLMWVSRFGCGLFIDALHSKWMYDPFIGGLPARGCGGLIDATYDVSRLEDQRWVKDCTMSLKPDEGVIFSNDENSVVKACFEEWLEADIGRFDFSFNKLRQIIESGSAGGNGKRRKAARA